jgi:hypothetical protein
MKTSIRFLAETLSFGTVALFFACSSAPLAGGNSSQTGNNGITVAAASQSVSGATRAGAKLWIYDQEYRPYANPPGFRDSTVASDSGRFAFTLQTQGYYNLLVHDESGDGFIRHIPVFTDSVFTDTLDSLSSPGFIAGTASDDGGRILPLGYIFVKGSPFYTVSRNDGWFLLGPLPPGGYYLDIITNFELISRGSITQVASLLIEIPDTSVTQVFPDSISQWNR